MRAARSGSAYTSAAAGSATASRPASSLSQNQPWGSSVAETEVLLPRDAPIGHDYWQLMNLAGDYAYAGREWVARKVVEILGGRELELVHNHHNFAWRQRPAELRAPTSPGTGESHNLLG
jgi:hypothetical protein